jgi:anti-sigma factor RsiW
MPVPNACQRFNDLWVTSMDGALGEAEHREYDAHLAACPACVTRVQQYVVTTQILQGLRAVEDAEEAPPLAESLVQRILAARRAAALPPSNQRTG